MSIFSSILHKIFDHSPKAAAASAPSSSAAASPQATPSQPAPTQAAPTQAAPTSEAGQTSAAPQLGQADVEAILADLAAKKGGGGNWKTSIVDLLRLLDLDSSLTARKELASELNVHAGEHGSAEQNIALSKAVWQQLAQNGGKVPDSLRS
ncbi:DUF3597 domain-containing protein [Roseococcus sp. SYP-B2431]|uniref:DUF3597 domain-containing protein n=1 Tax=Roseococcus sp. SYP-B2431 TaxID=2496640 RepID=UPI001040D3C1|nr:DUF3597 domain-containing protein [Roseococcus sp. SYP-B2431]TCH97086.1 DUF3597 domain-containing protein [Roseococcus sp. SYP-B2431]